MKNKITVSAAEFLEKDHKLILSIDHHTELSNIKPMEQLLADSDHFAFVYIMEVEDDYTYLVLPEHTWNVLKDANQADAKVIMTNGNEELLLPAFQEELFNLVENIIGNSNYGELMVEKVESIFQEMVQE